MSCKTGSSPILLPNGNVHCIEDEPLLVGVGTVPSSWTPFATDEEVGVAAPGYGMRALAQAPLRAPSAGSLRQMGAAMPSAGEQAFRAYCKNRGGYVWKRADWYVFLLNQGFKVDTTTMQPISSGDTVPLITMSDDSVTSDGKEKSATIAAPLSIAVFDNAGNVKYIPAERSSFIVHAMWGQLVCTNVNPADPYLMRGGYLESQEVQSVLNEFATDEEVGVAAPGYGMRALAQAPLRAPSAGSLRQMGAAMPSAGEQAFRTHCQQMHGVIWKRADWYAYLLNKGFQVDTSSMMPVSTSGSPQLAKIYIFGDNGMSYVRHVAADPGILVYAIWGQLVCTNDPGMSLKGHLPGTEVDLIPV